MNMEILLFRGIVMPGLTRRPGCDALDPGSEAGVTQRDRNK
jgi:hypothetical protein